MSLLGTVRAPVWVSMFAFRVAPGALMWAPDDGVLLFVVMSFWSWMVMGMLPPHFFGFGWVTFELVLPGIVVWKVCFTSTAALYGCLAVSFLGSVFAMNLVDDSTRPAPPAHPE